MKSDIRSDLSSDRRRSQTAPAVALLKKHRIAGMKSSRWRWHLDEVFVKINGERHYLWRAVDHEGEVWESFTATAVVSPPKARACHNLRQTH